MGARPSSSGLLVATKSVYDTQGLYERTFTQFARLREGVESADQVPARRIDLHTGRRTTLRFALLKVDASGNECAFDLSQITAVKLAFNRNLTYNSVKPTGETTPALTLTASVETPASGGLVYFSVTESHLPATMVGEFTGEIYTEVGTGTVQTGHFASILIRVQ